MFWVVCVTVWMTSSFSPPCVCSVDEFKGHSLLQAAREADMAKAKKTLALEIINFKHPQTHETALVRHTHYTHHTGLQC